MSHQADLFGEPDAPRQPATAARSGLVIADAQLGPEQRQFNQWLEQIEQLQRTLEQRAALRQTFRSERARRRAPLERQYRDLSRAMARLLDQRLQAGKGLSKSQRRAMQEAICSLATDAMDDADDAEMQALHERHRPAQRAEHEALAAAEMQEMMSDVFGLDLDDADSLATPEQVMAAALEKMLAMREAEAAQREASKAARRKSGKRKKDEQQALDAGKTLREVYRRLASALHPDRESDPQERLRKTALMVEANAANDRRDLLALLQLQVRVEQRDPQSMATMAESQLRHFNRVFKEQAQGLKQELAALDLAVRQEFGLHHGAITARTLDNALRDESTALQASIMVMTHDLKALPDDRYLKAWLKEQQRQQRDDVFQ